jgi:uncharacterized membrane protein YdcZ (DUF606 family)
MMLAGYVLIGVGIYCMRLAVHHKHDSPVFTWAGALMMVAGAVLLAELTLRNLFIQYTHGSQAKFTVHEVD